MTLWTIVPEEVIFGLQNQDPATYEELECAGQRVMAEKLAQNQYRVVRLLTTNPTDYLHDNLQPGTVITFKPVIETLS